MRQSELRARVHQRGSAIFSIDSVPLPEPVRGQILPKVEAAGVNVSNVKRGRGDAYPFGTEFTFVPGSEIAGTVVAQGRGLNG